MDASINYPSGNPLTSSISLPATLTTSEADIVKVVLTSDLKNSQLTVYGSVTLGGVASATFYYYYSPDGGTTWFPVCLYNTTTGEMTQRSVLVDSGTYATGGVSYFLDNVPLGFATAFKVTGKCASGTPAYTMKVTGRNN